MSSPDADETLAERQALARLEAAVGQALERVEALGRRATIAEARVRDLEELLRRFTRGDDDPARLVDRLRILQDENEGLRDRLNQGREGVERLLARIRFLEEQR